MRLPSVLLLACVVLGACGHHDFCVTPDCIHTASKLLSNMNPDIDPCDDFYEFACGNFINDTIIPDDKSYISTYGNIREMLTDKLRLLFRKPEENSGLRAFRLVHKLYKSCMDTELIAKRGIEPLKNSLKKVGGWPVLMAEQWNPQNFSWPSKIHELNKNGFSINQIVRVSIDTSTWDPTKRTIEIDQASLALPREYLLKGLKDPLVSAYLKYMIDVAVHLGADRQAAQNELTDVIAFETKLAEISMPRELRRNATLLENPMTIKQLQERYPYLQWLWYLQELLHHELDADELVNVNNPKFLKELGDILEQTPDRTLANHIVWRVVNSAIYFLTPEVRDLQLNLMKVMSGETKRQPRWKECTKMATNVLDLAAASMYVRRFFKEDAKSEAMDMVNYVRQAIRDALLNVNWMDSATRKVALEKLSKMHAHIAYPNELLDDAKLEEHFKSLHLDENLYMESALNVTIFDRRFAFSLLRQPVNRTDWRAHGSAAVVNAFYSPLENTIEFPAGIFQGLFFSNNRPRYLNYGCIGFTIGHEITHGFDDNGRQYDAEGRVSDWWAPDTKQAFLEKTKCIIEQYNSFVFRETNQTVNGVNTQGENIADLGGVKYAYRAYNNWVKDHKPEPQLPGLDYTPAQMFWLSAANKWCSVYKVEMMKRLLVVDPHAPARYRINGPFRNIPEFSKDFNCPLGSGMNPEKKCLIW